MGAPTTSFTKLKRPDDPRNKQNLGLATPTFAKDVIDDLSRARKGFVKNTGRKLGDVKNAGAYKKFTQAQKKEYRKRNPQDFKEDFKEEENVFTLGKPTLLGS